MAVVEGMPAGLSVDVEAINRDLRRRQQGYGRGERMKIETDRVELLSGMQRGTTTGAPLAMRIENLDWPNWRDRDLPPLTVPRPGHADYAGMIKYGLHDARPVLERASARETAARVAVGSLAKQMLGEFGVTVGGLVLEIGDVSAGRPEKPWEQLWALAELSDLRCPDEAAAAQMRAAIDLAREEGDSLGGVFEVAALGVPIGLGSHVHWERRLDARLAAALMGIPAIKGVEIGPAFANARRRGTKVHDEIVVVGGGQPGVPGEESRGTEQASTERWQTHNRAYPAVDRLSNRAGGIEGGISNGQPIVVRAAMKPIPTTVTPLRSVDMQRGEPATTQYQRSDVCAVPAAVVVAEAMVAWVLAGALLEKLGGDSVGEMKAHRSVTSTQGAGPS
jgi:chorismate synthase